MTLNKKEKVLSLEITDGKCWQQLNETQRNKIEILGDMKRLLIYFIFVMLGCNLTVKAQQNVDTTMVGDDKEKPVFLAPYHRNIIKFNPTPMVLFDVRNLTFSYERLLKNNQSVVIQAGYLVFPFLTDDTVAGLINITGRTRSGINLAFDYRYYVLPRNTRPAPDGLYIGGYLSYYGFTSENTFNILPTSLENTGTMNGNLNMTNLGFLLGYQFVFNKRFTIDCLLFGPSLSIYSGSFKIGGALDEEEIAAIDEELIGKLLERYPYLGTIFSEDQLLFTGKKTGFDIGFRYSIQLGYHF